MTLDTNSNFPSRQELMAQSVDVTPTNGVPVKNNKNKKKKKKR
jgi:hypothetical protein